MKKKPTGTLTVAALVMLGGGRAHADDYPFATVVRGHVFVVRGLSVRSGDLVAFEPSFWFVRDLAAPSRPLVLVARPMLGVGGSGVGIGLAPSLEPPRPDEESCLRTPCFWLPFSLEARVERMYGLSHWRHATYVGPTLSASGYIFKVSAGWMIDASAPADRHVQLAFGGGF